MKDKKVNSKTQQYQISCCDGKKTWLAYDGKTFDEKRCISEITTLREFWPKVSFVMQVATEPFDPLAARKSDAETLANGSDDEIQALYDKQSRSPGTGKLYMPSQKWGGWILRDGGVIHSLGGPFETTKSSMQMMAEKEVERFKSKCFVFSRRQSGCRLVSVYGFKRG